MILDYIRGSLKGRIMKNNNIYIAVTPLYSNTYKTLKGAKNFMSRKGYKLKKKEETKWEELI